MIYQILNLTVITVFIVGSIIDYRRIERLKRLNESNEKYIKLLEKRNKEDRIYKNKQK